MQEQNATDNSKRFNVDTCKRTQELDHNTCIDNIKGQGYKMF